MKIIKGNIITLAKQGTFDVIAHGCNCFCIMGAGLAPQMAKAFRCDKFAMENPAFLGDMNKLGTIDYLEYEEFIVVNAYTQYQPGPNLDYDALKLCLKKMNNEFKGKHIGLPWIGCGIAGGKQSIVSSFIQGYLYECKVTIVDYDGN